MKKQRKNSKILGNLIKLLIICLLIFTLSHYLNSRVVMSESSANFAEYQIKVLVVYNSSATVNWESCWTDVLVELGFESYAVAFQDLLDNLEIWENYDIILFDDSVYLISIIDALVISKMNVPFFLCGRASSFIDSLENIQSLDISWTGDMEIHNLALNHQIFHKPYTVSLNDHVVLSSEGWNSVAYNFSDLWYREFTILGLSDDMVVSAFYTGLKNYKVFWIAINDPSKLSINGRQFIANIIQYLSSVTNLSILADYIADLQIYEWHGKGSFKYSFHPDIESTYYGYMILQLVKKENLVNITSIINYLSSSYNLTEGSFTNTWNNMEILSTTSKSCATSFAVIILNQINNLELINTTKVVDFLAACQDASGGFADYPRSTKVNVINTWAVLEALKILNALNLVNATAAIEYLSQCQNLDPTDVNNYGGFRETPSSTRSQMIFTYYALKSLQTLSSLNSANLIAVVEWISKCKRSGGSFYNDLVTLDEKQLTLGTGYAVLSLKILGREDLIDSLTGKWLLDRQLSIGGFSGGIGDEFPQISETYIAITALKTLGKTTDINMTALEKYLLSCWNPDGGFYSNSVLEGSLWQTYNAIKILSVLNELDRINRSLLIEFLNATFSSTLNTYWEIPIGIYQSFTASLPLEIYSTYGLWCYGRGMEFFATTIYRELNASIKGYNELVHEIAISEITDPQSIYYGSFKILSKISETVCPPNFYATVFAVLTLEKPGALSLIKDEQAVINYIIDYIVSRQAENGSIIPEPVGYLPWPMDAWSAPEYYAVATLSALKSLSALNVPSLINYLISNINYNDVIGTYYVIKALKILFDNNIEFSVLENVNKSAVLELAYQTLRDNFTFVGWPDSNFLTNRLQYTWMMLSLLKDLGLLPLLEETLEIRFETLSVSKTSLYLGESFVVSAVLTDNFGRKLKYVTLQVQISDYIFNGTGENGIYKVNVTIPMNESFLGLQNIEIKAFKKGYFSCLTTKKITIYGFLRVYDYFSSLKVVVGDKVKIMVHIEVGNFPLKDCTVNINVLELNLSLNMVYTGNGNYTATLDTSSFFPGNYTINIEVYHPYTNHYNINKTIEVNKAQSKINVKYSPLNGKVFRELSFNITLQTTSGIKINDTITIKIVEENSQVLFEENLTTSNGLITFTWTPTAPGKYIFEISYQGNIYFRSATSKVVLIISKLKTFIKIRIVNEITTQNNIVTISIRLMDEYGNPIPEENIILEVKFPNNTIKHIYLITGSYGNTTYKIVISKPGTYRVKATFEGSVIYEASTATISINRKLEFSSNNLPFTIASGILAVAFSFIAVRYKRKLQIIGGGEF